jgi:hypothetical protein
VWNAPAFLSLLQLGRPQATRTNTDLLAVNGSALNIGFPLATGSYMGMAVSLTKSYALAADFTFSHSYPAPSLLYALIYSIK